MNLKHLFYFWKVASCGGVVRASEELHITPQTISGQIQLLEQELKTELFARSGRRLELTEAGRFALGYAKEIFSLQSELEELVRLHPEGRPMEFRVGVSDAMPESLAYRLLEPATQMPEPVRIVCPEWKLDSLLSELAVHRLDLVLADSPIPQSVDVRAYSHRLGESPLTFFASHGLADRCRNPFPNCLNGLPMLLPGEDSALRSQLVRWLSRNKLRPTFAGEFDGSALMAAFGEAGVGVLVAPTILAEEMKTRHGVVALGETREIVAEYFAISVERRLTHPCVLAITQAARDRIFKNETAD
jgi:LysR family transcriptional activator of nhaA